MWSLLTLMLALHAALSLGSRPTPDPAAPTYRAAVVQGLLTLDNFSRHEAYAERWVKDAAAQRAQIIVFAESALGSDTDLDRPRGHCEPLPAAGANPCDDRPIAAPLAKSMACLARKYSLYVVYAMCDLQRCAGAPSECAKWADASGMYHFNTQLALSPNGTLLAKYHKMHLADTAPGEGESTHASYPPKADPAYFDTDFGVRFGLFICMDWVFRTPAPAMALDPSYGIRDFILSTTWTNSHFAFRPTPPFLPPLELAQGWSAAMGANLLVANGGEIYGCYSGMWSEGRAVGRYPKRGEPPAQAPSFALVVSDVPKLRRTSANVQHSATHWDDYKCDVGEGCGLPSARAGALAGADAGAHGQSEVGEGPNEMVTTRFVPRASGVVRATTPRSRFSCAFRYTLSEAKMAPGEGGAALSEADEYALLAFEGKWQHVVPSRSCLLYKCTPSGGANCSISPLYDTPADLVATTRFASFSLVGSFQPGDLVLPLVATHMAETTEAETRFAGGSLHVPAFGYPLLNAMLFAML